MKDWIHLDLKGMMPGLPGMRRWVEYIARLGFGGIVFEYEDRLPLQSLPGLHRPVLEMAEWRDLWELCAGLGLEVVPLVQTQGHLEWVLKHPQYAHLREEGFWNELCPSHPDSQSLVRGMLDDMLAWHPDGKYVHVGGDETWHLGHCPRCRARAEASGKGPMGVWLEHLGAICRYAVERERRPIIWADMFWRTDTWSLEGLPPETILVDWHYGAEPRPNAKRLQALGGEVWGASAIRSGFDAKYSLSPLHLSLSNILAWGQVKAQGQVDRILHTVWGRTNSLRPLYGPWEGWLPGWLAAANPEAWRTHRLAGLASEVDRAMQAPEWQFPEDLIERLGEIAEDDPMVRSCLEWWALTLRHRKLLHDVMEVAIRHAAYDAVEPRLGLDPDDVAIRADFRRQRVDRVEVWGRDAAAWLSRHGYSDIDEYVDTKVSGLRRCLALGA